MSETRSLILALALCGLHLVRPSTADPQNEADLLHPPARICAFFPHRPFCDNNAPLHLNANHAAYAQIYGKPPNFKPT